MTKRDQAELSRRIQRDIFEDRSTIEGPMFNTEGLCHAHDCGKVNVSGLPCQFCEMKKLHTAAECGRRIGTNA